MMSPSLEDRLPGCVKVYFPADDRRAVGQTQRTPNQLPNLLQEYGRHAGTTCTPDKQINVFTYKTQRGKRPTGPEKSDTRKWKRKLRRKGKKKFRESCEYKKNKEDKKDRHVKVDLNSPSRYPKRHTHPRTKYLYSGFVLEYIHIQSYRVFKLLLLQINTFAFLFAYLHRVFVFAVK